MKDMEAYPRDNNNGYPVLGMYNKENIKYSSYSQAEFTDHSFDIVGRKRDSWSLNETVQKLYDLDKNIARRMFLDEYFNFMKKRGAVVTKIPVVAKLPLDLYRLYNAVQSFGGYAQVVKKRKWSRVVRDLGLPPSITSAAYTLRTQYLRLLYHFECDKNGVVANNLFFFEEQESMKQWNTEPIQNYDSSSSPPSSKRFKSEEEKYTENREEKHFIQKDDRREVVSPNKKDSEISYVELSKNDKERSMEKIHKNARKLSSSRSVTPPHMQRSRSEDIHHRRTSYDDNDLLTTRAGSLDNLLERAEKMHERRNGQLKRKHSEGESATRNEIQDNSNIEHCPTDDEASVQSVSPKPDAIASPKKDCFEGESTYNKQINNIEERAKDAKFIFSDNQGTRYTSNERISSEPQYAQEHRHSMKYEYAHRGRSHGTYPANVPQQQCRCEDCDRVKRFPGNGGSKPISYPHLPSPTSSHHHMPVKTGPPSHYHMDPSSDYERHMKRTYEMQEQRMKRYNGYRSPHRNITKLSTNPTEMNLKIKERTENAIVLSIVVDGIYYSGTLLTSIKR